MRRLIPAGVRIWGFPVAVVAVLAAVGIWQACRAEQVTSTEGGADRLGIATEPIAGKRQANFNAGESGGKSMSQPNIQLDEALNVLAAYLESPA